jgi:pimeloyl-ACP methyl ester carboxylesterase
MPLPPRLRLIISLLALLPALALFSAAKCYPPDTRVVVFIQGLYTSYGPDGTTTVGVEPHTFDTLKFALETKRYPAPRLLDYSYSGGSIAANGSWVPRDYSCEITDRASAESLVVLEKMLTDYKQRHPKAHFTLVGHSLGGYLAFLEGAREAGRSDATKLAIDGVVTFDAPLKGISADKKAIIDFASPCAKTYIAGAELVAARNDPTTPATRAAQAGAMASAGIRLATLGNNDDCLYNLPLCTGGGSDDTDSQTLPGQATFSMAYDAPTNPLLSHFVILVHPPAVADAVAFVGAP